MTAHPRPAARLWPRVPAPRPVAAHGPAFGSTVADIIADLDHRISYRQIDYWVRAYAAVLLDDPERRRAQPGSGYERRFSALETLRLIRMGRLVLAGHRPDAAARAARDGDNATDSAGLALAWATDRGECT